MWRWREDAFRQQHVEENLRFCSSKLEHPLTRRKKSIGALSMEILYTNCAGLDVHKILPNRNHLSLMISQRATILTLFSSLDVVEER